VPAGGRPVLLLAACQIRREGFACARGDELLGDLGLALQPGKPSGPYIAATGSLRSSRCRIVAMTWRLAR
jgi:hypothetical protein